MVIKAKRHNEILTYLLPKAFFHVDLDSKMNRNEMK